MDMEALKRVVERARKDAAFFHALVFDPERVLAKLPGMERRTKARLLALDPEQLIGRLLAEGGCTDPTCGPQSCLDTCGPHSCTETCKSSCAGSTCGAFSCGTTTSVQFAARGEPTRTRAKRR
jgi:hypothetical protein